MKKLASVVCTVVFALSLTGAAGATGFTFQPSYAETRYKDGNLHDLNDLEHGYAYQWGIEWEVPQGETIIGASLFFDDIRNWDSADNDLWVRLLDTGTEGVTVMRDTESGQIDFFRDQGVLLEQWHNLSMTATDITYEFDASELTTLTSYIADGNFGLGFDPDCHFWNNGITLTIETAAASSVPEPSTMLLLGCGLIGLVGLRRKQLNK